jgi:hypothetical protein
VVYDLVWRRKVKLFVKVRKQGARIESVPLKAVKEMSAAGHTRWYFEDGWLVLLSN